MALTKNLKLHYILEGPLKLSAVFLVFGFWTKFRLFWDVWIDYFCNFEDSFSKNEIFSFHFLGLSWSMSDLHFTVLKLDIFNKCFGGEAIGGRGFHHVQGLPFAFLVLKIIVWSYASLCFSLSSLFSRLGWLICIDK